MDQFDRFYNKTLKFLSFRPRSEKEIRDYLNRKKAESSLIEAIIKALKDQNFLNDLEFAKWWIEQRTKFKQRALWVVKRELKQKGVSDETIENQISNINPDQIGIKDQKENDLELAKKIVESKIDKYKRLSKQEIFKKLGGVLARRGFNYDIIKKSIDESFKKIV